jgi:hypothetical protein
MKNARIDYAIANAIESQFADVPELLQASAT